MIVRFAFRGVTAVDNLALAEQLPSLPRLMKILLLMLLLLLRSVLLTMQDFVGHLDD